VSQGESEELLQRADSPETGAHPMRGIEDANADRTPLPFRSLAAAFPDSFSLGTMANASPVIRSEKSWDHTMMALCNLVHDQGARNMLRVAMEIGWVKLRSLLHVCHDPPMLHV
jgi:hypothetical protein